MVLPPFHEKCDSVFEKKSYKECSSINLILITYLTKELDFTCMTKLTPQGKQMRVRESFTLPLILLKN